MSDRPAAKTGDRPTASTGDRPAAGTGDRPAAGESTRPAADDDVRGAQARHFDAEHTRDPDPWGVTSRWYEVRKRRLLLDSLPDERYGRVLELGCSIGVLTAELAERCDALRAIDLSQAAVDLARERVRDRPHVTVEQGDLLTALDDDADETDLVVLSEVGYYLSEAELDALTTRIRKALKDTGTLVALHWRYPEGDYRQSGDAVHERLARESGWNRLVHHEESDFLLDVFSADSRSVAVRTGVR